MPKLYFLAKTTAPLRDISRCLVGNHYQLPGAAGQVAAVQGFTNCLAGYDGKPRIDELRFSRTGDQANFILSAPGCGARLGARTAVQTKPRPVDIFQEYALPAKRGGRADCAAKLVVN